MSGLTRQPGKASVPSLADADWLVAPATQTVLRTLEAAGHEARVVGGAVRNALIGRAVHDRDIATTARPKEVIAICDGAGLRTVPTGLKHGTVTVIVNGEALEVTTLREDIATDGRHAEVRFTTVWAADASRRDFTINALYCDADGTIHDPLGGIADIISRTVRFIGNPDDRIREDYLRILRFFRLFAEYGLGRPDLPGLRACVTGRRGLRRLSGERLRQELMRLFAAPRALAAVDSMFDQGIWGEIFPTVPRLGHLARLIGAEPHSRAILRIACATVMIQEDVARIAEWLRLSNVERDALRNVAAAGFGHEPPPMAHAKRLLYRLGKQRYRDLVSYRSTASYASLSQAGWLDAKALIRNWQPPEFPLSGRDALSMGHAPGPEIGAALALVENQWLEHEFSLSREQLLEMLRTALHNQARV